MSEIPKEEKEEPKSEQNLENPAPTPEEPNEEKRNYINDLKKEKENIINQIQTNFKERGINFEDSNDLSQIYNLKSVVEKEISNNDKIIFSSNFETDFLNDFITYIKEYKKCKMCKSNLDEKYINILTKEKKKEIETTNNNNSNIFTTNKKSNKNIKSNKPSLKNIKSILKNSSKSKTEKKKYILAQ